MDTLDKEFWEKREAAMEAEREKRNSERLKKGEPITFSDKLKQLYKKLTYSKKQEMEYEAKKHV